MTAPSTDASSLGVMPLPVRVDPRVEESWVGYTQRVADFYGISWKTLMSGFFGRSLGFGEAEALKRASGIAVTANTAAELAKYFRLMVAEVDSMHLTHFNGSALQLPEAARELFDSRQPKAKVHRWTHGLGPIWPLTRAASCPECRRERPDHWPLSWRLRWHVICVHHHRLITDTCDPAELIEIGQDAVWAQETILNRLNPSLPNRRFFVELQAAAIREFIKKSPLLRRSLPEVSPEDLVSRIADLAAEAQKQAKTMIPFEEIEYRVASARGRKPPGYRAASTSPMVRRLLDELPLRHKMADDQEIEKLPLLLPTRWYVPDLSDLTYPMRIQKGRAAAALAVYLLANGGEPEPGTNGYGKRLYAADALIRLLDRLAEEGRTERYWEAARVATDAVLAEGIDYPQRVSRQADPAVCELAKAFAPDSGLLPRIWLIDQWACGYPRNIYRPRQSTPDGPVEEFDLECGPALTREIDQHLASAG